MNCPICLKPFQECPCDAPALKASKAEHQQWKARMECVWENIQAQPGEYRGLYVMPSQDGMLRDGTKENEK